METLLINWTESIFSDQFIFMLFFNLKENIIFLNFIYEYLKRFHKFSNMLLLSFVNLCHNFCLLQFSSREFIRKCIRDNILCILKKIENKLLKLLCRKFINYMVQKKNDFNRNYCKYKKLVKNFNFWFCTKEFLIFFYYPIKMRKFNIELTRVLISKQNGITKFKSNANINYKYWFRSTKRYLLEIGKIF